MPVKHLEQGSAHSECCVSAITIMLVPVLPVVEGTDGAGGFCFCWRGPCAWNSSRRGEKYPTLIFTINNPPPTPSPPLSPGLSLSLLWPGWWSPHLPGEEEAMQRWGGGLLQVNQLRQLPPPYSTLPAHHSFCRRPISCCGHRGGRIPGSSEFSVHASPRAWRHQLSAGLDSSPVPYFWLWGAGSLGKWQPRRQSLRLGTISSRAWKEAAGEAWPLLG